MALTIVLRAAGGEGPKRDPMALTFDAPRVVIGRGEGCEVRLPDPSVSHRHASIRQRGAVLWGGRLGADETVAVPDDRHVHVFVPSGSAHLEGAGSLATGDAVRLTGAGSPTLTAGPDGAEVLIWATA